MFFRLRYQKRKKEINISLINEIQKKEAHNYLTEQGTCCVCGSQPHSHEHLTLAGGVKKQKIKIQLQYER